MNQISLEKGSVAASLAPARGGLRDWQRWAPYAAVVWSLCYAALGIYWAVSGSGFPYAPRAASEGIGPMVGRFGPVAAWIFVIAEGLPAAVVGAAMLRGTPRLRPVLIAAGALLGGVLLLLMIELNLLVELAYIPFVIFNLITGAEFGQVYLEGMIQSRWTILLQVLCLAGGFLWLAATLVYTRRSGEACLYCGRRDGPEGWNSPANARRWGRIAVVAAMVVPVVYAFTRYAWALGIPLGMTEQHWRQGQASGEWISGLFLANVGLLGAVLTLGLVQRWGEVFPRWMIGLAGRRVPMALAVAPAAIMSVLLMVGGIAVWSGLTGMTQAAGETLNVGIIVGPVLLFPAWGIALAAATLGYYYRRRGACGVCGRGATGEVQANGQPVAKAHPLLTYLALTFLISWGGILFLIGRSGFDTNSQQSESLFTLMYLAMLAGPSIAGLLLTGAVYGKAGWRDLASRLLRWRVGVRWYALALLVAPLGILLVLLTLSRLSPDFLPRFFTEDDRGFLLQFSFAVGIIVAIFEELGWTGFAVHTLLKGGRDILSTGLIVGLLNGAWNFLVVYLLSDTPAGAGNLPLVIFLPATLFSWLPTYRVLMVWVYYRTGSLLLAMLMYASLIAFWRILTPLTLSGSTLVTYYLIFTAATWIIIAAALRRKPLSRLQHA